MKIRQKAYIIEYSSKEIPIIDIALTDFMGKVFDEFHRNSSLLGDSANIFRIVESHEIIYEVTLYESDNSMHKVRFENFIKKIFEFAQESQCFPDKIKIKDISFNITHPELNTGEIFLANETVEFFHSINWKSKRMGNIAYTIFGEPITNSKLFPVFAQRSEICKDL